MSLVIRLVVFLQIAYCPVGLAQVDSEWSGPQPIQSKALNEEKSYRVLLPPGYASKPEQLYPLLLLLDGQKYGDIVAGNARFLAQAGEIPEHVIVSVDSDNRLRDFTPTDSQGWEGDGGGDRFLAFLSDELMPEVERKFRVARPRILWGHSLGGLFALYTLYAAPELFDARLVNDGTLDWDAKATERALQNYLNDKSVQTQFLYFNSSYLVAIEDPELRYFETLSATLQKHAPANLRWEYEPMPNETHASIPLLGSIHGLRALYEGYRLPESVMLNGLDEVLKYHADRKGRIGAPAEVPESTLNELGYLMLGRDTAEAIRAFEFASRIYPGSANAWDSLSDGYVEAGRLQDALKAMDKCIEAALRHGDQNLEYFKNKRSEIVEKM